MIHPLEPTQFSENAFNWDFYDTDFFFSPDGTQEFPNHHCKKTWVASLPFITEKRNPVLEDLNYLVPKTLCLHLPRLVVRLNQMLDCLV